MKGLRIVSGRSSGMGWNMGEVDLKKLLQRVVELVMPNLRHYYRMLRKGRIVKAYASDDQYWADVQLLRNDESDDTNEPVITKVEIPILWGGPERGVVCPPAVGTLCDVEYYDGDPNYFRISNFRWEKNKAPGCELGAFIIQQSPEVFIKIAPGGTIINKTAADWNIEVGGVANITATEIHLNAGASVVTTAHICHLIGSPHQDGSSTVTAGF